MNAALFCQAIPAFSLSTWMLGICSCDANALEVGARCNFISTEWFLRRAALRQPLGLWEGSWDPTLAGPGPCHASAQVSVSLHSGYTRLHGTALSGTFYPRVRPSISTRVSEVLQSDLHLVCIRAPQGCDSPYMTEMT